MSTQGTNPDLIDIQEMAGLLGRTVHTVRQWLYDDAFPRELRPERVGGRKKMYWSRSQLAGMKAFAKHKASLKGWQGNR